MSAKVGYLVIDAADPVALARFWCGLLAVTVDTEIGEGNFSSCHQRRTVSRSGSSGWPTPS